MIKLAFGKSIELVNATCDYCGEFAKTCARTYKKYIEWQPKKMGMVIDDYNLRQTGFFGFGDYERVIKGDWHYEVIAESKEVKKEVDICGDCAKQIAKELGN